MSALKCVGRSRIFFNYLEANKSCHSQLLKRNRLPYIFNIINEKLHTTGKRDDIMEFFDLKKHWGRAHVQVGRSWNMSELRIKSNSDLHKLWYVLLKERNALMTMEHECNEKVLPFPNPERLDKVAESMENLEAVVRERNKAYYLLETGETGEQPIEDRTNCFGLPYKHAQSQHIIPKEFNKKYKEHIKLYEETEDEEFVRWFLQLYEEKKKNREIYESHKQFEHVCGLFKRFPNMDVEAVKEQFPLVDIEKARAHRSAQGHFPIKDY